MIDELDDLRARLAACERDRDGLTFALRQPCSDDGTDCTAVQFMERERDSALAEAERLRGAPRMIADEPAYHEPQTSIARAALSPSTPAAPPHDPTMPRGVVPGPTGAASSCRAHNHADSVPGVPTCLVEADERRYDAVAPSSSAPSFEYRRGYERAVEDAVLAVVNCGEANAPGGFRSLVERGEAEDAIRSLLPATEREGTEAEVEQAAETICDVYQDETGVDGMRWSKINDGMRDVWRKAARAVLAAQGEGRGK